MLLKGRRAIADYCGVWPTTVDNWRKRHAFPVCVLPGGNVATTENLIDKWILERGELQKKAQEKMNGKTVQQEQILGGPKEIRGFNQEPAQGSVPGHSDRVP